MKRACCCVVLLAATAAADEDRLVFDLVRRVACLGPRGPSDYDLGPLLALDGQRNEARRLLANGTVAETTFAGLRRRRAVWILCALLDHRHAESRARAAEALAAIGDARTAPVLWLHGRRHYVAYRAGTPGARLRVALAAAQRKIGMESLPKGFDFLVRRWLAPRAAPEEVEVAKALQRRADAGEEITWEMIVERLPPTERPIAGDRNWRWYPIGAHWIVSCHFIHGLRTVRVEPRLPEATRWGVDFEVCAPPRPSPKEAEQMAALVSKLDDPIHKNRVEPVLPGVSSSGPRIPRRAAVWDLLPYGGKVAHVLIPRLTRLDDEGEYAGNYLLGRVVSPGVRLATEILGDKRSRAGRFSTSWSAWLDLVSDDVPRGGLAVRLRGSRRLANGAVELDYTIGWFGNWSTSLPFAGGRPEVTVLAEDADGRRLTIQARERYDTPRSNLHLDPHTLLLGRFLVPNGRRLARARVRLSLPPAPAARRGLWSGTIESNSVAIAR